MNNLANINTMNKNVKNKSPGISINDIQTKNKIKKKLLLLWKIFNKFYKNIDLIKLIFIFIF